MVSFTLDTNCLIDLDEEGRLNKVHVRDLVELARSGGIEVSILASSASEKQIDGTHLDTINAFKDRLTKLELDHLDLLPPIARMNLSFYGFAIYPSEEQMKREQKIFETLFPECPFEWLEFADSNEIDPDDLASGKAWKWRNRMCDAQAYWAHEYKGNNHFVTSDANFRKKLTAEAGFPDASILTPSEAANMASE